MGRLNVYLNDDTEKRLRGYIKKSHGTHRVISLLVEEAINSFLDKKEREERLVAVQATATEE